MTKSMKREGPDPVDPVTIGGTRYEAVHWGDEIGVKQNGGYIAAFDVASGTREWLLQVYEITYDEARERDVQDLFITRLFLVDEEGLLGIDDEDGRSFIVDTRSRTVRDA